MNYAQKIALFGFGLLSAGVLLFMRRKSLSTLATSAIDEANDIYFQLAIPNEAGPYARVIKQVAAETGIDPFVITAIGMRETGWGTSRYLDQPGPAGRGDNGHGHGLMQIDDRTWASWLGSHDWADPYTNISKGAEIYSANLDYFVNRGLTGDLLARAALAAYNHGPGNVWQNIQAGRDPDVGTASGNYSAAVWGQANALAGSYASAAGVVV